MAALPDIVSPTVAAIDAAVVAAEDRRDDLVVRGSSIGKPCERALWYRFRWADAPEDFSGRMLRLFATGHVEEARLVGYLRQAGMTVADVDPSTGEQWEVVALDGHFKGHLDGIVEGVPDAPKTAHLLECKTHNAKSFAQLLKAGVAVAKPEHVAQMQVYMHLKGLTRALYLAKNKDDDQLHVERIPYDATQALALMAKAERIAFTAQPPARISENPDFYVCRFCPSVLLCHGSLPARRNCRTCLHSTPMVVGDGRWTCARHSIELNLKAQAAGCPNHLLIPGLVAGEQIDADEAGEWVLYRRPDGSMWRDGEHHQERAA